MAILVVDASVALAWALPDEASPYADAVLVAVENDTIYVPQLWAYEVANGLTIAYRRQRITVDDEQAFLTALGQLNIRMKPMDPLNIIKRETAMQRAASAANVPIFTP